MISIKINGEYLDLFPDTRISLKLKSPIFADGNVIPGSYSIPFQIPAGTASEKNSRIFGHPDVIEGRDSLDKYDAELFIDGVLYKTGQIKISSVNTTSITTNFVFGFQTLQESIKEKSLRDICTASVSLFNGAFTKTITLSFDTENTDIGISINGFEYSQYVTNAGDAPTSLISQINAESADNNCVASNVGGKLQLVPYANPTDVTTPFNINGNPNHWTVEHNNATYHNTVAAGIVDYFDEGNEPDDIIRFPMFKNTGVYTPQEHTSQEVNGNTTDSLIANIPGGSGTIIDLGFDFTCFNYNSLCPMVKLSYVLAQIESTFGITFAGDFIGSNWHATALIFNTVYLDIPVPYLGNSKSFIFYKDTVVLAEHLPDMKVNDFLKALQTRFNLAIYLNEQTNEVVMNYRNTIVSAGIIDDLTPQSSTPMVADITTLKGVLLKSPKVEDDTYSLVDEYFTGTEHELEIETKCNHLSQYANTYSDHTYGGFQVPIVHRKQEAKRLELVFENYDQDMLSGSDTFFTADIGHTTDDYLFADIYGDQWDQYVRFLLNRKLATASISLQLRHLLSLDFENKYRIAAINYLINTIDVTLTMQGIEPAKVTMYSI